jgi:hypothetical protein
MGEVVLAQQDDTRRLGRPTGKPVQVVDTRRLSYGQDNVDRSIKKSLLHLLGKISVGPL